MINIETHMAAEVFTEMDISRVARKQRYRQRRKSHFVSRFLLLGIFMACALSVGVVYSAWFWIRIGAPYWKFLLGAAAGIAFALLAATGYKKLKTISLPQFKLPKLPKLSLPSWSLGSSSKESYIGLDVGTSSIKVVRIAKTKQGPKIVQYGILPTPANAVENGQIKDQEVVVQAVRQLFQERKIRQDRVITVLTGQNLIVRHVEFPQMSESELREALKWEAEQYIPIPKDDSVVDFQVVSPDKHPGPDDKMQVMLVATYRQPIQDYINVVKAARLKPEAIDIEPLAVLRALQIGQPAVPGVTVVVDMGAGTTNLSIFAHGILQMARIIPIAGNDLTRAVTGGLAISLAEAEQRKKAGGLVDEEVASVLQPTVERLIAEITRSIEFFLFRNRELGLAKVWLVGGGASLKGFDQALAHELSAMVEKMGISDPVPVEIGHPALQLEIDPQIAGEVRILDTILAPALGLALREVAS